MPILQTLYLLVIGVVFVVWSVLMFRMLWRLTRRSLDKLDRSGGGYFTWVGHSLSCFGEAATSRSDRPMRRQLMWWTLAMIALIAFYPLTLSLSS